MNAPPQHGHHRTAHLDTARTGRMPDAVRAVLARRTALDDQRAPTPAGSTASHGRVREHLGRLLGVPAARTALATSAADAFDTHVRDTPLGPRDRIWTTPHETLARLHTLHTLRERTRCRLEVIPLRPDGDLDLDWIATHLGPDVALVSVAHLSPACGTVNPVAAIGRLLAPHRARYAVDASHSAGLLPLHAAAAACHLLTADGHRFLRGPHPTAFTCTTPGPETGPAPVPEVPEPAAVAALEAALAHHGTTAARPHEDLLPRLRAALARTPGITVLPAGRHQAGILAFRHRTVPAAALRHALARRGVLLSKTVAHEHPLHPAGRDGDPALRASVHHDNTAHDIDRLEQALAEALREHHTTTATATRTGSAGTRPALAATAGDHPTPTTATATAPRPLRRRGHLTLHPTP
ncbi:aminotransferase class V-fold PLP-dependent enzyme [Streptomyces sp. NPDC047014]|uniref:aminotransferase class V-fold PLP-dependent enzyme n=1 Tax=Streptomyces sp. NPDC047014 TaxID=3155736 RepID=UPI0034010BBE